MTFATPRLGNATFVDEFHALGIAALRIENKGDVVPKVPGVSLRLLDSDLLRWVHGSGRAAGEADVARATDGLLSQQPITGSVRHSITCHSMPNCTGTHPCILPWRMVSLLLL
jgi:hypothetical protein